MRAAAARPPSARRECHRARAPGRQARPLQPRASLVRVDALDPPWPRRCGSRRARCRARRSPVRRCCSGDHAGRPSISPAPSHPSAGWRRDRTWMACASASSTRTDRLPHRCDHPAHPVQGPEQVDRRRPRGGEQPQVRLHGAFQASPPRRSAAVPQARRHRPPRCRSPARRARPWPGSPRPCRRHPGSDVALLCGSTRWSSRYRSPSARGWRGSRRRADRGGLLPWRVPKWRQWGGHCRSAFTPTPSDDRSQHDARASMQQIDTLVHAAGSSRSSRTPRC